MGKENFLFFNLMVFHNLLADIAFYNTKLKETEHHIQRKSIHANKSVLTTEEIAPTSNLFNSYMNTGKIYVMLSKNENLRILETKVASNKTNIKYLKERKKNLMIN